MSLFERGRSTSVLAFIAAGGIGVISSTQTWLEVHRADGAEPLLVSGAHALPLLAPLTLAVLALGAALSIVGPVLRYVFGVLAALAAVALGIMTLPLIVAPPLSAVASSVTEATGLAGEAALHDVVGSIAPSVWPGIAFACWILLLLASLFVMVSARRWKAGGRRYRTADSAHGVADGPLDAVESWDDLSHGTDPTR